MEVPGNMTTNVQACCRCADVQVHFIWQASPVAKDTGLEVLAVAPKVQQILAELDERLLPGQPQAGFLITTQQMLLIRPCDVALCGAPSPAVRSSASPLHLNMIRKRACPGSLAEAG